MGVEAEGLVPFALDQHAAITPQVDADTRQGDYFLIYRFADDGQSIETQFRGPSGAVGAALHMRTEYEGDWHSLICSVGRSEYHVTLAKWRVDDSGQVAEAYIRKEAFVEWRALSREPGQLAAAVEWRPLIDDVGIGAWSR